jgi:tRNA G26 N,N-dimethylase Trm1
LGTISEESKINSAGFYDLHDICRRYKIKNLRKKEIIKDKIKKMGYHVCDTHFKGEGIRSDISLNELIKILK